MCVCVCVYLTSNKLVLDQYIHFILVYILNTTGMTNLMITVPDFKKRNLFLCTPPTLHNGTISSNHYSNPVLVRDEASCSSSFPHPGHIACCPAPDRRPPATKALHTICGNNSSIVSSS